MVVIHLSSRRSVFIIILFHRNDDNALHYLHLFARKSLIITKSVVMMMVFFSRILSLFSAADAFFESNAYVRNKSCWLSWLKPENQYNIQSGTHKPHKTECVWMLNIKIASSLFHPLFDGIKIEIPFPFTFFLSLSKFYLSFINTSVHRYRIAACFGSFLLSLTFSFIFFLHFCHFDRN